MSSSATTSSLGRTDGFEGLEDGFLDAALFGVCAVPKR